MDVVCRAAVTATFFRHLWIICVEPEEFLRQTIADGVDRLGLQNVGVAFVRLGDPAVTRRAVDPRLSYARPDRRREFFDELEVVYKKHKRWTRTEAGISI